VPGDEPFLGLFNQGYVLGENGDKMSKSRGNVIGIDETVERYGADALRLFEMFAGPPDTDYPWSTAAINGVTRTLGRVWRLVLRHADALQASSALSGRNASDGEAALRYDIHFQIKRVTEELDERMHLNTCVSSIMTLLNDLEDFAAKWTESEPSPVFVEGLRALLLLLAPFAPCITEELWERTGHAGSVHEQAWPLYDERALERKVIAFVIQVNGKWRGVVEAPPASSKEAVFELAREVQTVKAQLDGKSMRKLIFVPDKLLNIVVG
jgi:leucyl-tRNA synthetase